MVAANIQRRSRRFLSLLSRRGGCEPDELAIACMLLPARRDIDRFSTGRRALGGLQPILLMGLMAWLLASDAWGRPKPTTDESTPEASSEIRSSAIGSPTDESTELRELPKLAPREEWTHLAGKPVAAWVLLERGSERERELAFSWLRPGLPLSTDLVRRVLDELLDSGRYAELSATVEATPTGLRVRFEALARHVVAELRVIGDQLPAGATTDAVDVAVGEEITAPEVSKIAARVWQRYERSGFPEAQVAGRLLPGKHPSRVVLELTIDAGSPRIVRRRRFQFERDPPAEVDDLVDSYAIGVGDRADGGVLDEQDRTLEQRLRQAGWFQAEVRHEVLLDGRAPELLVQVRLGKLVTVRFEGNRTFDRAELRSQLELESNEERTPSALLSRVRQFYLERGFFDARFEVVEIPSSTTIEWLIQIRERPRLKVVGRWFPCLSGSRNSKEVNEEIDGVIAESLPGGDDLFGPVDGAMLDAAIGTQNVGRRHVKQFESTPWHVYTPEAYDKALNHVRDLYRSEGYLSALVGPPVVMRRRCDPLSQPGQCRPLGQRVQPPSFCPDASRPIPIEDTPADPQITCRADDMNGERCEPNVVLSIPIKLGPRTQLWDVQFEGNSRLVETDLERAAKLKLGRPVSQFELQKARRRLLSLYADEGFAFASVDVDLELSEDHTRGRVRFIISEREPVYIKSFVVRGAKRTSHGVILGRVELEQGGLFRSDLVRLSEEQLATLGVFSSVTVALQDPEVPAREKVVVIRVQERPSQYLEVKPGFSTGEGARVAFEYGHRNLLGRAVQLRFRVRLGYLPSFLIFDSEVRRNFDDLNLGDRLERSNTVTLEFPVAKRYRLAIDGVDARDNARDFGITKRAAVVTLTHTPTEELSALVGSSFEVNDARVFGETESLQEFLEANPDLVRLLNVPEGTSFAIAVRGGGTWDRRDSQLGPTRGTLVSAEVEPVVAYLSDDSAAVQLERCEEDDPRACEFTSRFVKFTNRVAGYIPFDDRGLSLALSVRWGANFQLVDNSATYPDRLFFFGGVDSLRGFLEDSVIPQDIAERLQPIDPDAPDQENRLTARDVVIRGGDFIFNPRAELRIPLTRVLHTAVFLDTGNIWRELENVDPTKLRYTMGTGLRAVTPIGPLALDYGIKLDRRFYEQDLGAFHFSVGLF